MIKFFYTKVLFKYPLKVLSLIFAIMFVFIFYANKLEIDASSETLLLQNDKDLKFSRLISKKYKSENFLVITYSPKEDLLSESSLKNLKIINNKLLKLKNVKSITSILNVPLLHTLSSIKDLGNEMKTLQNSKVSKQAVKKEFLTSPLYKNNLVSKDFKTTAILINLIKDEKYYELLTSRNNLKEKRFEEKLNNIEKKDLEKISLEFKIHRDKVRILEHQTILDIRQIIKEHKNDARLFLGGINMIADDIVTFVKNDLFVYGSSLILILILVLYLIFREIKWVLIPILICLVSVIFTTGALGFFSWEVTVISSNFIALQLIITISIILHLIVRYEELLKKYPKASHKNIILNTILSKIKPTFFAIITTIAGFASLIFSNIAPVINLGWMMSAGIFMSLIISFILFPTILVNLAKSKQKKQTNIKLSLTRACSTFVQNDKYKIYIFTFIFILISLFGISKLIVENSFISYFKKNTQIYQGMEIIDKKLGGTTPLDIIITFKNKQLEQKTQISEEDSFDEEFEEDENDEKYWFTNDKMKKILLVHKYLESLDEIGSVQSFATMLKIGKKLNQGENLDSFKLALLYNKTPKEYKDLILSPYLDIENDQIRFTTRVIDSNKNLRRDFLINKIKTDLKLMLPEDKIQLSNLMILYNNMLQSLFDSQIKTISIVILILFIMFLILFKSFKLALISIVSNLVPIGIIFAFMGLGGIPLDIMTITIAAISIGVGVDDTIHYIHRFKKEYKKTNSYLQAMKNSHNSIAHAMVYTTLAIVLGFSILLLSNLIPTIYFGLLTLVVMITILLSALILLPKLLITFKTFN